MVGRRNFWLIVSFGFILPLESRNVSAIFENLNDFSTFNRFYRKLLHDVQQHRSVDTVLSPIDLLKIQSNQYDEIYLRTSCYENARDLFVAHGYNLSNFSLTADDVRSLLPALLSPLINPGCARQKPVFERHRLFDVWIIGFVGISLMKLIQLIIFYSTGDQSWLVKGDGQFKDSFRHSSSSIRNKFWFGLTLNSFTSGLMLGTVAYHLIPHIYHVVDEDYHYTYLLRGTVLLCGCFLFFLVEKLLRLRFQIQTANELHSPDVQMKTIATNSVEHDEDDSRTEPFTSQNEKTTSEKEKIRPLLFYDLSHDAIYGCGLATAFAYDLLTGFTFCLLVFSEGFRRYAKCLSVVDRTDALSSSVFSVGFLLIGYIVGGIIIEFDQQFSVQSEYLEKEYIYSIVYGSIVYTALVTLIPELDDLSNNLQLQTNVKRRAHVKTRIFLCQGLFAFLGVLLSLIFALIWRYFHRLSIFQFMFLSPWIVLLVLGFDFVSTIDHSLSKIEENLLDSQLQTQIDFEKFYEKILQSNGIDDRTPLNRIVTSEDIDRKDLADKCFKTADDLFRVLNVTFESREIARLLPFLAEIKLNDGCRKAEARASWKNLIIGLITVSFVNCSALCGAIILPFRKRAAFKWILSAFIGLAVGTLTGSGIFHLIPRAFNIPDSDTEHHYLTKALIPMIIIYLYYMRDQFLKIFFNVETIVSTHQHGTERDSAFSNGSNGHTATGPTRLADRNDTAEYEKIESVGRRRTTRRLFQNLKTMKAAGWMIFLGDMLHNFIDGLTLGAAFMVSISEGLRMSLPIICEEFPHELGDIAILLSSGLTLGQALIMNFLSACSCYVGFIVGAKLGELEEFHPWIYALAGGMFIYIGLADMVPELVSMGDEIEKDYLETNQPITTALKIKILLCQNSGVILGVILMFFLGKYGEHLENLIDF